MVKCKIEIQVRRAFLTIFDKNCCIEGIMDMQKHEDLRIWSPLNLGFDIA